MWGTGAAALVLVLFLPEVMRDSTSLGVPALNGGVSFIQGVGIEAIATFFLMTAVFGRSADW